MNTARPTHHGYIAAIVIVAAATALRAAIGTLGVRIPFVTFYPAVMIAGIYAGMRAGLLATALSAFTAGFLFMAPVGRFWISTPGDWLILAIFAGTCILLSYMIELTYRALARAKEAEAQLKAAAGREEAAAALRESEERYRVTLSSIGDAVIATDAAGLITFVNPVAASLTGWEENEALGRRIEEVFRIINEQTRKPAEDIVRRVLRDGHICQLANHTALLSRDGREIPLEDSAAPIRDEMGKTSGVVLVFHDVTQQRREKEAVRHLNRTLRALSSSIEATIHAEDVSDLLEAVCRIIVDDCGHPMVWIGFAEDDENKTVRPVAQAGFEEGYLETIKITWSDTELGAGPSGTAIRTGTPDVCRNMLTESRMRPWREQAIKRGYASSVALPLRAGGRTLGALTIYSREPHFFSDDEVKLLAELADDLAYGITALRLRLAHRQSEKELRESRARLDLALRSAGMGAWHWDITGNRRCFDDHACHILGIDPATFSGAAEEFFAALHPDDRETISRALSRTLEQDVPYAAEYRAVWPDGGVHYIAARGKLVRDDKGRPVRLNGLIWDISERRQMEEELCKSRDELELRVRERTDELVRAGEDIRRQATLLNLAHDAILVRGLDHRVTFWNQGAEKLYAYSKEEALGKVTQDLLRTGFPEPVDKIVAQVLQSGSWEGELRQTTSTGKEIIVESRWALQPGRDGEPLGFLEINRDVTARKLAEEALRSNMARLELVNAELQEFAHVASHDLQEPLRKIQTFCDMAMKRCAPALDSTSQEYLDRVLKSASRMRQLLRDLLEFSRVAARPEPFKEIDLVKIAREAADVFEASVKETGCQIEIENMPAVEADESQMSRLFQNLIGNALKFRSA